MGFDSKDPTFPGPPNYPRQWHVSQKQWVLYCKGLGIIFLICIPHGICITIPASVCVYYIYIYTYGNPGVDRIWFLKGVLSFEKYRGF